MTGVFFFETPQRPITIIEFGATTEQTGDSHSGKTAAAVTAFRVRGIEGIEPECLVTIHLVEVVTEASFQCPGGAGGDQVCGATLLVTLPVLCIGGVAR